MLSSTQQVLRQAQETVEVRDAALAFQGLEISEPTGARYVLFDNDSYSNQGSPWPSSAQPGQAVCRKASGEKSS